MTDRPNTTRTRLPAMLAVLTLAALGLAGCLGDDPVDAPTATKDARGSSSDAPGDPTAGGPITRALGRLVVKTTNADLEPIPEVEVVVGDRLALSDTTGAAWFEEMPPGHYNLTASKDGWRTAHASAKVNPGATAEARVKLLPPWLAPETEVAPNQTYQRDFQFSGVFQCSLTYVIIPGDCLTVIDAGVDALCVESGGQVCLPVQPGDNTDEAYTYDFPLDRGWTTVIVEQVWRPVVPTDATGNQMQLALEPAHFAEEGHAPKYARAQGGSPLYLRLESGVPHPTESFSVEGYDAGMPNPDGGEVIRTRSYITGAGHNPGGTNFHGVGAAYGQRFDVYITVFYGAPAPDGFSAIPPS